jgi:hypothetical protein
LTTFIQAFNDHFVLNPGSETLGNLIERTVETTSERGSKNPGPTWLGNLKDDWTIALPPIITMETHTAFDVPTWQWQAVQALAAYSTRHNIEIMSSRFPRKEFDQFRGTLSLTLCEAESDLVDADITELTTDIDWTIFPDEYKTMFRALPHREIAIRLEALVYGIDEEKFDFSAIKLRVETRRDTNLAAFQSAQNDPTISWNVKFHIGSDDYVFSEIEKDDETLRKFLDVMKAALQKLNTTFKTNFDLKAFLREPYPDVALVMDNDEEHQLWFYRLLIAPILFKLISNTKGAILDDILRIGFNKPFMFYYKDGKAIDKIKQYAAAKPLAFNTTNLSKFRSSTEENEKDPINLGQLIATAGRPDIPLAIPLYLGVNRLTGEVTGFAIWETRPGIVAQNGDLKIIGGNKISIDNWVELKFMCTKSRGKGLGSASALRGLLDAVVIEHTTGAVIEPEQGPQIAKALPLAEEFQTPRVYLAPKGILVNFYGKFNFKPLFPIGARLPESLKIDGRNFKESFERWANVNKILGKAPPQLKYFKPTKDLSLRLHAVALADYFTLGHVDTTDLPPQAYSTPTLQKWDDPKYEWSKLIQSQISQTPLIERSEEMNVGVWLGGKNFRVQTMLPKNRREWQAPEEEVLQAIKLLNSEFTFSKAVTATKTVNKDLLWIISLPVQELDNWWPEKENDPILKEVRNLQQKAKTTGAQKKLEGVHKVIIVVISDADQTQFKKELGPPNTKIVYIKAKPGDEQKAIAQNNTAAITEILKSIDMEVLPELEPEPKVTPTPIPGPPEPSPKKAPVFEEEIPKIPSEEAIQWIVDYFTARKPKRGPEEEISGFAERYTKSKTDPYDAEATLEAILKKSPKQGGLSSENKIITIYVLYFQEDHDESDAIVNSKVKELTDDMLDNPKKYNLNPDEFGKQVQGVTE